MLQVPEESGDIKRLIDRLPKLASSTKPITVDEAEALIAYDDDLFDTVATYKWGDPDIFEEWPHQLGRLIKILKRIKPFKPWFKTFYRGQPYVDISDSVVMKRGLRSWSANRDTAEDFARGSPDGIVLVRAGPVKGVEISGILMWRMRMTAESHYSGMQAEWLLLDPVRQ
jgi:predicted heme/steroid binding protein